MPPSGVHSEVNSLYRKPADEIPQRGTPQDAIDFFLAKLAQPAFFFRFLDMIRMERRGRTFARSSPSRPRRSSAAAFTWPHPSSGQTRRRNASEGLSGVGGGSDLNAYNGLKLISSLAKRMPDWLKTQPELVKALWGRWSSEARAQRLASEEMLAHAELVESKLLVKCFVNVVDRDHEKVPTCSTSSRSSTARTRVDYTFRGRFLQEEVPATFSRGAARGADVHFLTASRRGRWRFPSSSTRSSSSCCRCWSTRSRTSRSTPTRWRRRSSSSPRMSLDTIVMDVLETADDERLAAHADPMRIQLLRMGTLLIRNLPDELVRHRKELIKFGWNHLKSRGQRRQAGGVRERVPLLGGVPGPGEDRAPGVRRAAPRVPARGEGARAPSPRRAHPRAPEAPAPGRPQVPDLDPVHQEDPGRGGPLDPAPHPRLEPHRAPRVALLPVPRAVRAADGQLLSRLGLPSSSPPRTACAQRQPHGAHPPVGGATQAAQGGSRRDDDERTTRTRRTTTSEDEQEEEERNNPSRVKARPPRRGGSPARRNEPRVPTVRPPPRTRRKRRRRRRRRRRRGAIDPRERKGGAHPPRWRRRRATWTWPTSEDIDLDEKTQNPTRIKPRRR